VGGERRDGLRHQRHRAVLVRLGAFGGPAFHKIGLGAARNQCPSLRQSSRCCSSDRIVLRTVGLGWYITNRAVPGFRKPAGLR
jgi:hypothetical protein